MQAISGRRYLASRWLYSLGCSIGVLTERLATICELCVDAIDISSIAIREASQRCGELPNVKIQQGALPEDIPGGTFDLLVFSEIGYCTSTKAQLKTLIDQLIERMVKADLFFLAVHWLGFSPDHILSGSQVHKVISLAHRLTQDVSENHTEFLLG